MDYQKHYDLLMEKARGRAKPAGYVERHHVLPRSMGGSNAKSNLVYLSAREHFVAHFLWAKVHGGSQWLAIVRMKGQQCKLYNNSRLYEVARKNRSIVMSDMLNKNHHFKGKKHSQKSLEKMSASRKGLFSGKDHYLYGKKMSDEMKEKLSNAHKGVQAGSKNPASKKVKCVENGMIFDYCNQAAEWLKSIGKDKAVGNVFAKAIREGKMRYGYHWEYV